MNANICALVIGLAIFATDASAATINLFYTGVVTSVMSLPPSGVPVGDPISVSYFFDTDLASPGNYINTGTFSSLSGTLPPVGGAVVRPASFASPVFLNQICGMFCTSSSQIDTQSAQLQAFQSVSSSFLLGSGSVQTQLFSNPAIPGDITAAFALEGVGIGTGSFFLGGPSSVLNLSFRIDTVSANGAVVPLPAALPLFAAGLGIVGLLGWRRKRKATPPNFHRKWKASVI